MISELTGAIVKDTLMTLHEASVFELSKTERKKRITEVLGKEYPEALVDYAESISGDGFMRDVQALLELIGSNTSVIEAAPRLMREKNLLFKSILASLSEARAYESTSTALGQHLASIRKAGRQYEGILTREMQTLYLHATGKDSATVQIAVELDKKHDLSKLPGIASVSVNKSLLGGARLFFDGTLQDESWRARLTQVLKTIEHV